MLTLTLGKGTWSALRIGCFTSVERVPINHWLAEPQNGTGTGKQEMSLLGIQFQFPSHPACSITTCTVFHLCAPISSSKLSNFSQLSYCRIHTSNITHLRGYVNAFPVVQAPMFLQISCLCNINPQVLHLNGLSPS